MSHHCLTRAAWEAHVSLAAMGQKDLALENPGRAMPMSQIHLTWAPRRCSAR